MPNPHPSEISILATIWSLTFFTHLYLYFTHFTSPIILTYLIISELKHAETSDYAWVPQLQNRAHYRPKHHTGPQELLHQDIRRIWEDLRHARHWTSLLHQSWATKTSPHFLLRSYCGCLCQSFLWLWNSQKKGKPIVRKDFRSWSRLNGLGRPRLNSLQLAISFLNKKVQRLSQRTHTWIYWLLNCFKNWKLEQQHLGRPPWNRTRKNPPWNISSHHEKSSHRNDKKSWWFPLMRCQVTWHPQNPHQ